MVLSNRTILCNFKPPCFISPSRISFLHFGGLPHHKKSAKVLFISCIQSTLGLGRDSNICVILEIKKGFNYSHLPIRGKISTTPNSDQFFDFTHFPEYVEFCYFVKFFNVVVNSQNLECFRPFKAKLCPAMVCCCLSMPQFFTTLVLSLLISSP